MPAAVSVLVADLRREPVDAAPGYKRDFLQETQLLYGEEVAILEEKEGWLRVEALQQPKYAGGVWSGYPGWIRSACVCETQYLAKTVVCESHIDLFEAPSKGARKVGCLLMGAYCHAEPIGEGWMRVLLLDGTVAFMPVQQQRPLLELAASFLGAPYLWGGCSPYLRDWKKTNTSVDCSGLVHLIYRAQGRKLPRDARDQRKLASPLVQLLPGDLLFHAEAATPEKIDHVLIFEEGEMWIEACLEAVGVRRIALADKYGLTVKELLDGEQPAGHVLSTGRV